MTKPFYLKVNYQNKIKKYAIHDITQIKFIQIKSSLGLNQNWKDCLFFYQVMENFNTPQQQNKIQLTQQELIKHLEQSVPQPNSTIKLRIVQRALMSEEQRRRKESQSSMGVPQILEKKRSKSMQLQIDIFDQTCKTQLFQMTNNFIANSDSMTFQFKQRQVPEIDLNRQIDGLDPDKKLTKSTEVSIDKEGSFCGSTNNLLASWTTSNDFQRIRNRLHESLKITENEKTQLQKLKSRITKRQQELQPMNRMNNIDEILKILDIGH